MSERGLQLFKLCGSSVLVVLLILLLCPLLILYLILQLLLSVVGYIVSFFSRTVFKLFVRHIYTFKIGLIHTWLLRRLNGANNWHSRLACIRVKAASGANVSIYAIPCLVDNYCYLIVSSGKMNYYNQTFMQQQTAAAETTRKPKDFSTFRLNGNSSSGKVQKDKSATRRKAPDADSNLKTADASRRKTRSKSDWSDIEFVVGGGEAPEDDEDDELPAGFPKTIERRPRLLLPGLRAVLVDVGDAEPVFEALDSISKVHYGGRKITVEAILTTHHHWDHQAGNSRVRERIPNVKVYGGWRDRNIACQTHMVEHGSEVWFGRREAGDGALTVTADGQQEQNREAGTAGTGPHPGEKVTSRLYSRTAVGGFDDDDASVKIEVLETGCHTQGSVVCKN